MTAVCAACRAEISWLKAHRYSGRAVGRDLGVARLESPSFLWKIAVLLRNMFLLTWCPARCKKAC